MNFATQVIIARRRLGHCEQILTVARADLEVNGPSSGINTVKTGCQILQSHAVTRPQLAQCLSLPTCRAAFANDETTNRPRSPRYCGGTPGRGRAQEKKVPSMGEDAEAYGRFGMRPAGFYRLLEDIPNAVILSPMVDSLEVSRGSLCVTVITGTVGVEAAAIGIPAITFGLHNWWDFMPHVHAIQSWTELRGLLHKICVEENSLDAKARRRRDGARLVQAIKSSAVDLAGIDYTSARRAPATEEEVDRVFTHLMNSLEFDREIASVSPG